MSTQSEKRPLEGVRVVDWTHVLAGPFAGYQLALLGAEVIRVERTDGDEMIRATAVDSELGALGLGEAFVGQGGGKRSLAVDAKHPVGEAALRRLIATADVLLENFRPRKLAGLGFDPGVLIQEYPKLIVCSITGFGPESDKRAYDHVVQAASGLMAANTNVDGVPQRVGFPLVDYATGQQAAMAILAALYRRDANSDQRRTSGEWLQVSMTDAALTLMAPAYIETLVSGKARPRSASTAFSGSSVSGTFDLADSRLAIVCNAKVQTEGLFSALKEKGTDPALLSRLQVAVDERNVTEAQAMLAEVFGSGKGAEWEERLTRWGVPAAIVRSPAQAAVEASEHWPRVTLPATASKPQRAVPVPGIGFSSNKRLTSDVLGSPPRRGQDTRAILAELGWTPAEIETLFAEGAAVEPGH